MLAQILKKKTVPKAGNLSPERFLKNRNNVDFIMTHISEADILDIINPIPGGGR